MTLDGLALTAGAVSVAWCGFACLLGVFVARAIRIADALDPAHTSGERGTSDPGS